MGTKGRRSPTYSLVQWNRVSDVTGCMKLRCIQWSQRTNSLHRAVQKCSAYEILSIYSNPFFFVQFVACLSRCDYSIISCFFFSSFTCVCARARACVCVYMPVIYFVYITPLSHNLLGARKFFFAEFSIQISVIMSCTFSGVWSKSNLYPSTFIVCISCSMWSWMGTDCDLTYVITTVMARVVSWIVTMTSLVSILTVQDVHGCRISTDPPAGSTSTVATKSQCSIWTCSVLDSRAQSFITQLLFWLSSRPVRWAACSFWRGTWLWPRFDAAGADSKITLSPLRLRPSLCPSVSPPCLVLQECISPPRKKSTLFLIELERKEHIDARLFSCTNL